MSSKIIIPSESSIEPTLEMLFGDDLAITQVDVSNAVEQTEHVAIYVADDDTPIAACGCDNAFAAFAGASLSRIPVDVAQEAAVKNDFSEMMVSNFYEVMNICSKLLMDDHSTHLRLTTVQPKTEANGSLANMNPYANFQVDIPRYGAGKIAFFSTTA